MPEQEKNAQQFLDLIRKSRKGKFKIYIGMSAGVGKTFRMLQEAQTLLEYYMGKNTPDRQVFIINNLKIEKDEIIEDLVPVAEV